MVSKEEEEVSWPDEVECGETVEVGLNKVVDGM